MPRLSFAGLQEACHETHHVRLKLLVPGLTLELSHPYRTRTTRIKEVGFEYLRNLYGLRLAKHDPKPRRYVFDSATITAHQVEKIVGIFAKAARLKCESFQRDECARATNPDVSYSALSQYSFPA